MVFLSTVFIALSHIRITRVNSILYGAITNGYPSGTVLSIPEWLRHFRLKKGLRQEDVADHMKIAQSTLSKWERGKAFPDLAEAARLAELYEATVNQFIKGPDAEMDRDLLGQRGEIQPEGNKNTAAGVLTGTRPPSSHSQIQTPGGPSDAGHDASTRPLPPEAMQELMDAAVSFEEIAASANHWATRLSAFAADAGYGELRRESSVARVESPPHGEDARRHDRHVAGKARSRKRV